jgi:inhibitor of cysteine peptidase
VRAHQVRRRAVHAVVVLAMLALLAACGSSDDSSAPPVYHEGDSIRVQDGRQFVIALTANPSTGYTWQAEKNDKVRYLGSKQVSAANQAIGAAGTQELRFEATATGTTTLALAYARPFEKGVPPAQTASFDGTVK